MFQSEKVLHETYAQYNEALNQSSELRQSRDRLLAKRNTFSSENIQRLERLLPDNIDNIRLIVDINSIASRYYLQIVNIAFAPVSVAPQGRVASVSSVGSVDVTFSVTASYGDFLAFLQDLERSARIVEVEGIKFSVVDTGVISGGRGAPASALNSYTLTVRTYWLK